MTSGDLSFVLFMLFIFVYFGIKDFFKHREVMKWGYKDEEEREVSLSFNGDKDKEKDKEKEKEK